ncbi:MAG: hypothetical protein ACXW25_04105 [Rhodospirillales bacterium]|nr:hypothetical protein [Rhodospirillales bacterium]
MARKPNYRFDRLEKDRAKAAKKAERLKAKQERSAKVRQPGEEPVAGSEESEAGSEESLEAEPRQDED